MAGRGNEIPCKQGCGQTFVYESWRVRHELRCKGAISTATEGRIAARSRALVPVGPARMTRRAAPARATTRRPTPERRPQGESAIVAAATDKATEIVIAGLIAKRDLIDRAIAALQAVSA